MYQGLCAQEEKQDKQCGITDQKLEIIRERLTNQVEGLMHIDQELKNFRDQVINEPSNSQTIKEINILKMHFLDEINTRRQENETMPLNRVVQLMDDGEREATAP
jgi:hypothetical protein